MKKQKDARIHQGLHTVARGIHRLQGYRLELRHFGEMKLGLWRKKLREKKLGTVYPKRLVLMPGFGDTPLSWHGVLLLLPTLRRQFDEIILFDFPGFGGFLSHERAFSSLDQLATSVSDVLHTLKPHTLIGHSLGGWLAANYAAHCGMAHEQSARQLNYSGPESLIVINPSGIYSDPAEREKFEVMIKTSVGMIPPASDEVIKMKLPSIEPTEYPRFSFLRPHLFAKEPKWFRWIAPQFENFLSQEEIVQFINSTQVGKHSLDQKVNQIRSKTWVIWGELDTLVPQSCASAWLDCLSETEQKPAWAIYLKDVGHSPHLEAPFVTAAVIGQILYQKVPHTLGNKWWRCTSLQERQS